MDDLLQEFVAETRETLDALSGEIVMWESDPSDRARLDAIFRFVHTVKGSCGFLDLPRLLKLSHAAEDVLSDVRSGKRVPDTQLVNAVLAVVDRIGAIVEAIDADVALDSSGEELLIAALAEGSEAAMPALAPGAQRAASRTVRLSVDLLDRMMSGMSDMVLARNELARRLRDDAIDPRTESALDRLSLTVAEMRDTVTRTRMQKIDALFSALPRLVRDVAADLGKPVSLSIEGSDVELDREMIEMMRDPLVHMIRNAIDHGIEDPAARRAAGKDDMGHLAITASQTGNQIIIELADDGRGIDTNSVIAKLAASGERSESELRALPEKAKLDLVFEPGLTTKAEVNAVSGRGVGMDIVRANIEQIGGRIELTNNPGKGLRVAVYVPLTLSIMSTIVVQVAEQHFALPRQLIEEIVPVRGGLARVDRVGASAVATVRDRRLPLVMLADALGLEAAASRSVAMIVIVSVGGGSFALGIDAVLDAEELVIKPAAPAVMTCGLYAGQTLPDTGRPMLLIDALGVATNAGLVFRREGAVSEAAVSSGGSDEGRQILLFLDLDGQRRGILLDAVDRIETVPAESAKIAAGALRLSIDNKIVPLFASASIEGRHLLSVMRLADGAVEVAYAIADALDIITIADPLLPAATSGPIAGVLPYDGGQLELIDVHWLFSDRLVDGALFGDAPICLLAGAERSWMRTFLRTVIESAGYRAVTDLKAGETAALALAMEGEQDAAIGGVPVIRLRRHPGEAETGEASIYRYDRQSLLAAIRKRTA